MAGKVKNADGSWSKFSGMKNPSFAEVTGNPNDNTNLKNALDAKQADIMSTISGAGGQYLRRKSDNTGLEFVTGGGGGGGVADVKVDGASVVTSGVAEIDLTEKLDKLPKPTLPGSGGHYNFPYNAEFTADGSKIDIQIETMSLDGDEAQQSFTKTVPAATTTTAGLMTAADKVKLDNSASASDLSTHTSNTDIHVTATEKLTWANKQAPLTISQMRAVNSGITDAKVLDYDNHKSNTAIHVTADEKSAWDGKSKVSVSASGTSTNVVSFIKVNDVEYKLPSSGGGGTITDVQVDGTSCVAGTVANITGKYSKPTTGIPKSDLADAVSESLDRADSAVQEVETGENNGTIKVDGDEVAVKGLGSAAYTASTAYATSSQGSKADTAYQKPASGIPKSDLADDVKTSLGKADTALQTHQDISGKADVSALTSHTGDTGVHVSSTEKGTWNGKYSKPTDGIPKSDLADDVKTSLGKADTAVQSVGTGSTNGTVAVDGADVAVKGLGTAAYKADTFFVEAETGKRLITTAEGTKLTGIEDGAQVNDIETVKVNGTALGITSKAVDVTIVESSANGKIKVNGSDVAVHGLGTAAYTDATDYATATALTTHTSNVSNPHSVTATQVGLGNVENKSGATIRSEMTAGEVISALAYTPADNSKVGIANGIAQLGSDGKVPSSQLPAYVDSIIEVETYGDLPATGSSNKIYIVKTGAEANRAYRWGGTTYVEISASLALGETSSTAYAGDKGKIAYDHSQIVGGTGVHVSDAERTAWTAKQNALTTAQLNAVDSGVTATKVGGYDTHVANNDIHVTTAKKDEWDAKYEKDADGIPKSDLHIDVKNSLEKADSAIQSVVTGTANGTIKVDNTDVSVKGLGSAAYTASTDYASAAQGAKADTALQSHQTIATGGANGTIAVGGTDVAVKGLGSAAYTASTDYATSTQGSKADTAYQKPASGIPASDLADAYGDSKNPYGSKTAKYVLAAPSAGGAPSFRALKAEDISDMEFITQAEALAILNS